MTLEAHLRAERNGFVVEAGFRVPSGRTVALVGPNGAGKSTLVAVLAGLLLPAEATVRLGQDVLDDTTRRLHVPPQERRVGVVFQDLLLFPQLSAIENAAFPLRARGMRRHAALAEAGRWLERLGAADRANARASHLSGGEAQRVALARALVGGPRMLLLDEPLTSLDVRARGRIRSLLRSTLEGYGGVRILITHDPVEAMMLADHLIVLENGRVTQSGSPEEIRTSPRTEYAAEFVGVNLFAGRLVDMGDGAGRLETPNGDVIVAWPSGAAGPLENTLGLLHPADVSLFRTRPEGSARNVLGGPIDSVILEGGRARVRIRSSPPVVAEVTAGSIGRLGLRQGVTAWASFKAVEVRVILPV
jgi:molybdate transport system ATP-binding protein